MSEVQWVDPDADVESTANEKYPQMLDSIERATIDGSVDKGTWAILADFEKTDSARDLASRLSKKYGHKFEIVSRKGDLYTTVFARLKVDA